MNTATTQNSGHSADARTIILTDIRGTWGKFSELELDALKSNDDLVSQIAVKYSLDKTQAQRDIDAVMKGRQI